MTGKARDAYSLSHIFLRTMQSTARQTLRHSIPCQIRAFHGQHMSWSKLDYYSQITLAQILGLKERQYLHVVPQLPNAFSPHPIKTTLYGQTRAGVLVSCSSYQTSATSVEEKPKIEVFLVEPDEREKIKQAMTEYLEMTLRVRKQLALDISQNSPAFLDGLVQRLKAVQKESSSDLDKTLNRAVKQLLARSKFKGVEPFLESLGVEPQEVARVSNYARSGVKGILVKVDLLNIIGIKPEAIPRVLTSNPRFLSNALVSHQAKVEYLAGLGMSPVEICKLITSYPNSLSFGLKDGGLPLVTFLKGAGVKDEDIRKVLTRCPQLLTLNVERRLEPAIQTLASVGITGSYLARVLVMQPSLLRRRLERNIAFCRQFGLDAKPGVIARLLVTCPNFSVEGCTSRVSYLNSIGLTKEQIVSMINKNPAFMSLNVKTALAPKVDYLVNVMGRPVEQLVTAATFLTMSLEHRIKPRHEVLVARKEAGFVCRTYSLSTMVTWSDEYFFRKFVANSPLSIKKLWMEPSTNSDPKVGDLLAQTTYV